MQQYLPRDQSGWSGVVGGEAFQLETHGAQDVRAYGVVKDLSRVERLVSGRTGWTGAVIALSNEPSYWRAPGHDQQTNVNAFRLYGGCVLEGRREWGPLTGSGTKRNREADLMLRGTYHCTWHNYSALPGTRFRYLAFAVDDVA